MGVGKLQDEICTGNPPMINRGRLQSATPKYKSSHQLPTPKNVTSPHLPISPSLHLPHLLLWICSNGLNSLPGLIYMDCRSIKNEV
ncbi:MAG: hypothetical protein F6K18_00015 [Okeania sp. SIO2C2]|uniref:hypothetical protein n=1 Tax=Okeania sp. SIO2C2 TaxID=2607787 RepID=UPI0013B885D7|nr:hypothetical protein [Okeania sp. SIO2C2]NEP85343.1 hypothetical protein [Okeania sp. SIO2C2]